VLLAATSAAAFAAIDLRYGLAGRLSPVYLADAGVQICFIAGILLTRRSSADSGGFAARPVR
jgi:hypothetical protein